MIDVSELSQQDQSGGGGQQENLSEQVRDFGRDLKDKAAEMGDSLGQTARDHAAKIKDAAADLGASTSGRLNSFVQNQREAGADYIHDIAQAVHRAAREFDRDIPRAAQYIHKAGEQIDSLSGAVRERDAQELLDDLQEMARRQPAIFFGGAMLLGFAALRFLKAGQARHPQSF